jgi:hypothetical protein
MSRALFLIVLSLGLAGCIEEETQAPAPELMSAPELSHAREPRMTADPAPPMHEDLHKTENSFITSADQAPVVTSTPMIKPDAPAPGGTDPGVKQVNKP